MTSLTFNLSRAIARTWDTGDEIVVTRLDHDANITPWVMAAQDRGCTVRWVDFHPEDGTLDLGAFSKALEGRPKLVAVGYASNALGTINPVAKIIQMAHEAGAWIYVDAVQYAPHGPIDVQALDCDFLVASSYKFFGPHMGVLYGKYDLLDSLTAYKVRPAPQDPPGKFETGTGNFEGMCGVLGALEYIEWVGETFRRGTCRALRVRLFRTAAEFQAGHVSHPRLRVRAQPGAAGYPGRDTGCYCIRYHG